MHRKVLLSDVLQCQKTYLQTCAPSKDSISRYVLKSHPGVCSTLIHSMSKLQADLVFAVRRQVVAWRDIINDNYTCQDRYKFHNIMSNVHIYKPGPWISTRLHVRLTKTHSTLRVETLWIRSLTQGGIRKL